MLDQDAPRGQGGGRPLSVLHVITGLGDGGAEAVLHRLVTFDRADRHAVVALMERDKYGPLLEQAGVKVHALGMPRSRLTRTGIRRLWSIIRASDADVIQTWMYHSDVVAGGLARMAGRRAIVWGIHNSEIASLKTKVVARVAAVASYAVPHTIISCSEEGARRHRALGYAERRIVVVPNGYDLTHFERDEAARERLRAEWGVQPGEVVLGTVARWDPQKDHANLVRAMESLDPAVAARCRLVLVGTGMDESNVELAALLEDSPIRERTLLLGRRSDVPGVMSAFDLHVLTSVAEAFPNVLSEAMACGTPCVVTDTGDCALIVGDTGWVAPPRDSERLAAVLAEAIASLADEPATRQRQRDARERIATHFSLERMADAYRGVWHAAVEGRTPGR
ncbi:MAG: glycosyltransferase [Chloroflexota bacterium]